VPELSLAHSPLIKAMEEVATYRPLPSGSCAHINWLVSDQLGTPRMIFDKTGALATTKRHDYAPFGEEIFNGLRTTAMGYGAADSTRQKFTSKERDNETGLDYFLVRYHSSTQGRFTSADEFKGGARELFVPATSQAEKQALAYSDIFTPQSLNKYQYCLNNPLRYVDPDGHDYRIVEEKERDGKPVKRYVWDRGYTYKKGDKNGAPPNGRYIDTQGRAIQLWGDNKQDLKKGRDHTYSVVEPTKEGFEKYTSQPGEAPKSFVNYDDTEKGLLSAGYKQHFLDMYPDHWGGNDYSKPQNPTLHVTLFPSYAPTAMGVTPNYGEPLQGATFHTDKHTQAGSWGDLGTHLEEFIWKP
jgi:RHS repeat-associated protein